MSSMPDNIADGRFGLRRGSEPSLAERGSIPFDEFGTQNDPFARPMTPPYSSMPATSKETATPSDRYTIFFSTRFLILILTVLFL